MLIIHSGGEFAEINEMLPCLHIGKLIFNIFIDLAV